MAQFDRVRNQNPASKRRIPYLLDVQADLLRDLAARVVVPLARPEVLGDIVATRLNPIFRIGDADVVLVTQEIAAVPAKTPRPKVTNLAERRNDIVNALDLLLAGV